MADKIAVKVAVSEVPNTGRWLASTTHPYIWTGVGQSKEDALAVIRDRLATEGWDEVAFVEI